MKQSSIEITIQECNSLALNHLSQGNLEKSYQLLERAQALLESKDIPKIKAKLHVSTLINFGNYYQATEQYDKALQSFDKALEFKHKGILGIPQIIELYLNLCSLHKKNRNFDRIISDSSSTIKLINNSEGSSENASVLAHYYLGYGFQETKNMHLAELNFKTALQISYKLLGSSHPTTSMIMKAYLKLQSSIESSKRFSKNGPSSSLQLHHMPILNDTKVAQASLESPANKTKIDSQVNSRTNTSHSRHANKCGLPRIRGISRQGIELGLESTARGSSVNKDNLPKVVDQKFSTPKNMKFLGDEASLPFSITKNNPPKSSRRIRCRRLSADSQLEHVASSLIASRLTSFKNNWEYKLIVLIQKHWRGYLARKHVKKIKRKAADIKAIKAVSDLDKLKIQMLLLKILESKLSFSNLQEFNQRFMDVPKIIRERLMFAILTIQKNYRMFKHKKRFILMKNSIIIIQRTIKMHLVKDLYQKILCAIRFIQYSWRNKLKNLRNERIN